MQIRPGYVLGVIAFVVGMLVLGEREMRGCGWVFLVVVAIALIINGANAKAKSD